MDTETITISEAAARAGVSRKTIQRGIGAGKYAGAVCVELPNGTKQWRIPTAAVPAGVSGSWVRTRARCPCALSP
jgi:hypothetical protein